MRLLLTLCTFLALNMSGFAALITSVANGNAKLASTWDCSCVPTSTSDLVIQHNVDLNAAATYASIEVRNGAHFHKKGVGTLVINGDLIIATTGKFTNDVRTDIGGDYRLSGTHAGTKPVHFFGVGKKLIGAPGSKITNTSSFILRGGAKEIPVGSILIKDIGLTRVNGITVHNNGSYQAAALDAISGSKWYQGTNAFLGVRANFSNLLALYASAAGNTVAYNKLSGGSQTIRQPVGGKYFNLDLISHSVSHHRQMVGNLTILGDLTIDNCQLEVHYLGVDHQIDLHGDWVSNAGNFIRRQGTVRFMPSMDTAFIYHSSGETYFNLQVLGSWPVVMKTPVQVDKALVINGELSLSKTSQPLVLRGNLTNNGMLRTEQGAVTFSSDVPQQITGGVDYYDLRINNTGGGVTVASGIQRVKNALDLISGTFFTNDMLIMVSDINGDSRITQVVSGNITGNVEVQRYIDQGATNWRFLTAPVTGATLADWNDDFITSGYAGSDFPSFPFTSIYTYDESAPGTQNDGFVPAGSSADPIAPGNGLWVWCGDELQGTDPFQIDVKGPVLIGNVDLPVSYTNHGSPANDGWSMVANPYVSVIDWNSPNWTKVNINDALYIWDPDAQQFAGYVAGVPINGGSNLIASSQAFWVQTNGPAPQLTITEGAKSNTAVGFKSVVNADLLRMSLSRNGIADEAVIRIHPDATHGLDASLEAYELPSVHTASPNLSTGSFNGDRMMLNAIPAMHQDTVIQIAVQVGEPGTYELSFTEISGAFLGACISVEDQLMGTTIGVNEGSVLTFTMDPNDPQDRFRLRFTGVLEVVTQSASCAGSEDGLAVVYSSGQGPWTYSWFDANDDLVRSVGPKAGPDSLVDVFAGEYTVQVEEQGGCGVLIAEATIHAPAVLQVSMNLTNVSCTGAADGAVESTVSGGTMPYNYAWSTGETTANIVGLAPGSYELTVTDANGCTFASMATVQAAMDVQASFTAPAGATAGAPILFQSSSINAAGLQWDMGDGTFYINDVAPQHTYTFPGIYMVQLTASNGDCMDMVAQEIEISDQTNGIEDLAATSGITVTAAQNGVMMQISNEGIRDLEIRILDVIGKLHASVPAKPYSEGQHLVPFNWSSGQIYLVQLVDNASGEMYTWRVAR